ncbi:carbohydrate ABC transporter permease [Ruminiclostridium cellobioparum]|uniref:carbohydrate ABC transporter permease n=1 Tax=Ruminiclostridium cellobioparum TaxID=29355 RepID=UPI000482FB7D|nr:carbohydrate ABC transporter permease [Ruminiclostridium cellobioparum]
MNNRERISDTVKVIFLTVLAAVFLAPILIVLMNSFKGQFFISDQPFQLPNSETWAGLNNYINGMVKIGFLKAFYYSFIITVPSVLTLVLFTSMTAWYITRVKGKVSQAIFYIIVASMIVPFQMVMFTMSKMANILSLDNPLGIIIIYWGFGAGLSVFMFAGFVKSIPLEIEESATIDGCNPVQLFFSIVFPVLKPISITVSILNAMWIWNDYLLPYLVIGNNYRTIPIAVQYLQGGYGSRDMGALMAMLILAIVPIIIFYMLCQKHIIKGVVAGAVKG